MSAARIRADYSPCLIIWVETDGCISDWSTSSPEVIWEHGGNSVAIEESDDEWLLYFRERKVR